jgi:PAS domain S-box-containing protein
MAMALKQQRPVRGMEAVAERPDGTRVPFVPYPTPLFDASGKLTGAINMLADISNSKRAEALLARRMDEQAVLYQLTDRVYRARSQGEICEAALDAIARALQCERASILLFDEVGVMRFAAWRGLSDGYRTAVEGHSPWVRDVNDPQPLCIDDIETAEFPESLKSVVRAERIGALAFIPLVANGQLIGKFMTYYEARHAFNDAEVALAVTIARQLGFGIERMRADQASRLLSSIIATSDDAIVSKDLNGIVTSWNRGAERVFGYTAEEMIGRPILTVIPPDRHNEEVGILERIRRGERIDHYETVRQRKDGSLIDIALTVSPVKDAAGTVVGASKIARDISEKRQAQARQELLTREIQHRTKNLFALVLAVVGRSFAGKRTVEEAEAAVVSRLRSLAETHVMLIDKEWRGADLGEIVRTEMNPYAGRVQVEGPSVMLNARAAQNFALALHELATNAAKYGALSNSTGRVHVSWLKGPDRLTFRWEEQGGPPVRPPGQRGFGSVVLEQVMAEYFEEPPRIDFASSGIRYSLTGSLDSIAPSDDQISHPGGCGA